MDGSSSCTCPPTRRRSPSTPAPRVFSSPSCPVAADIRPTSTSVSGPTVVQGTVVSLVGRICPGQEDEVSMGQIVRACTAASLFLLILGSTPVSLTVHRAQGGSSPGRMVITASHGLRLTLVLPKQVYAVDELVRMTVRVQNVSRHGMVPVVSCDTENPRVEVSARTGYVLYPPPVPFLTVPKCPAVQLAPLLPPGAVWERHQLVIVRGHYIRASATFSPVGTATGSASFFTVRTRPVWERLVPRDKPAVQLCAYSHLCVNIEPPVAPVGFHVRGPLFYASAAKCITGGTIQFDQKTFLSPAPINPPFTPPRYRIYPGCSNPVVWDFVVGWLNTPTTYIHYAG